MSSSARDITAKGLELLKQIAPHVTRARATRIADDHGVRRYRVAVSLQPMLELALAALAQLRTMKQVAELRGVEL